MNGSNPTKLCLQQGATLSKTWTWFSGDDIVKPITAAALGYPTSVTAPTHGLPVGWIPVTLLDVGDLSSKSLDICDRIPAKKIDGNTFMVKVDSIGFAPIASGYVVYTPPKDLTGFTASASFVSDPNDTESLLSLASPSDIVLGTTEGTVNLIISAAKSALFTALFSYWNLELTAPSGEVYRFRYGTMEMSPDIAP